VCIRPPYLALIVVAEELRNSTILLVSGYSGSSTVYVRARNTPTRVRRTMQTRKRHRHTKRP